MVISSFPHGGMYFTSLSGLKYGRLVSTPPTEQYAGQLSISNGKGRIFTPSSSSSSSPLLSSISSDDVNGEWSYVYNYHIDSQIQKVVTPCYKYRKVMDWTSSIQRSVLPAGLAVKQNAKFEVLELSITLIYSQLMVVNNIVSIPAPASEICNLRR